MELTIRNCHQGIHEADGILSARNHHGTIEEHEAMQRWIIWRSRRPADGIYIGRLMVG